MLIEVVHIFVVKIIIIGSDGGLLPGQHQASVSVPMLECCWFGPWGYASVEFWSKSAHFHSGRCIWECRLGVPAVLSQPQCVKMCKTNKQILLSEGGWDFNELVHQLRFGTSSFIDLIQKLIYVICQYKPSCITIYCPIWFLTSNTPCFFLLIELNCFQYKKTKNECLTLSHEGFTW